MKRIIKKRKELSPKQKIVIIVIKVIAGVICLPLLGFAFVMAVYYFPRDATTMNIAQDVNVGIFSNYFKYEEEYFDTLDEAVDKALVCYGAEANKKRHIEYALEREQYLLVMEDENAISVIAICNWRNTKNDKANKILVCMTFDKVENQISAVKDMHWNAINSPMRSLWPNNIYEYDEKIAMDVMYSLWFDTLTRANNDISVAYGISDSEAIKTLTILGEAPDGIEEIEKDGVTYYFWYYTDVDMLMPIRENLNLNEYYLPEVVECLDIQVEDPAEMEE